MKKLLTDTFLFLVTGPSHGEWFFLRRIRMGPNEKTEPRLDAAVTSHAAGRPRGPLGQVSRDHCVKKAVAMRMSSDIPSLFERKKMLKIETNLRASSEFSQLCDCKFISGTESVSVNSLNRARSRTLWVRFTGLHEVHFVQSPGKKTDREIKRIVI